MKTTIKIKSLNIKKADTKRNRFDDALMKLGLSEKEKIAKVKKTKEAKPI